jgi:hypothetical protein
MEAEPASEEPIPVSHVEDVAGRTSRTRDRARVDLGESSTSRIVYATMVGLPCVPEDACTLTVCSTGTASIPNGNASRNSLFLVNGSSSRTGSSPTSRSFSRQYGVSTLRSRRTSDASRSR